MRQSTALHRGVERPGEKCRLGALDPGSVAVILDIDRTSAEGQRLLDLGSVPHTEVRVLTRAPLGDPMLYSLRGTHLCLRRTEADRVLVRPV